VATCNLLFQLLGEATIDFTIRG